MAIYPSGEVTSALPASWERIGYVMKDRADCRAEERSGVNHETKCKRADEPSESTWLLPPIDTCNPIGVTSALPLSQTGIEYLTEGKWVISILTHWTKRNSGGC
ncbi:hypothetical protein EVAR_203_1 [Eumeta japonica]|uniref:Uncharacterized protein n=1 Tax=Eumeta variegata TaxID=151549 RepID=A0A4C1SBC6_EUMVA|nr:hypothetical protein EVAR_203_1 [Eumeta japonica]